MKRSRTAFFTHPASPCSRVLVLGDARACGSSKRNDRLPLPHAWRSSACIFATSVLRHGAAAIYGGRTRTQTTEELLRAGARKGGSGVVYLAYFGGERHVKAPSPRIRRSTSSEIYAALGGRGERLKRHPLVRAFGQSRKSSRSRRQGGTKPSLAYPRALPHRGEDRSIFPQDSLRPAKEQAAFSAAPQQKHHRSLYGEN